MNYVVFDLEWNQPRYRGALLSAPVPLKGEIIQIGAVRLNKDLEEEDRFRILITPRYYKKMNSAVSRLTRIRNEDLKQGIPFPEAFTLFSDFCGPEFILLTWGPDDIPVLRSNLLLHGIDPEWIPEICDLQTVFTRQLAPEKRQYSLSDAVEMVGETMEDAHDALNDAAATASVCRHLDPAGWAEGSQRIAEEQFYPTRSDVLKDPALRCFEPPDVSETIRFDKWTPRRTDRYLAFGRDPNGVPLIATLRLHKTADGLFRVTRSVSFADEQTLTECQAACRLRRKKRKKKPVHPSHEPSDAASAK